MLSIHFKIQNGFGILYKRCETFPVQFFVWLRLLDILAGHKDRKGLGGVVMINGEPQPVNFKCKSAYVVQVKVIWYICISIL